MNIVSFFSGAGGMDLGFAFAGHNIIWANDIDEDAVKTYNKNIGKYTHHYSICENIINLLNTDSNNIQKLIPNCDILIGGFPCQGFTIANLNRSMDDERNHLYLQLLKAISVKLPKFFLLENVKGLENMENGKILSMILNDLEFCGTKKSKYFPTNDNIGYTVIYNVLNAYNFGVPQNRERVIILGIRNDVDKSLFERNISNFSLSKKNPYKKLIINFTHDKNAINKQLMDLPIQMNKMYDDWQNKILFNKNIDSEIYTINTLRDAIFDLPHEYEPFSNIYFNHTGTQCKVKIKNRMGNRPTDWDKYAPTIMGRGSGTGGPLIPPHPEQHRRLSIREVARIQTFPDNFIFEGSNSSCYRQIGNAVPVLMAYSIAKIFPLSF